MRTTIYVIEQHDQLLKLWRTQGATGLSVLHLDFHCDLRGLLINRPRQRAFRIWDRFPALDQGNFLTHAIMEGRIKRLRWVHHVPGGRQYDLGTVKYESDLSALPHRALLALRRQQGIPLAYDVMPYDEWADLTEGEVLDIDWDFFACQAYPVDTIPCRVRDFLDREFPIRPKQIYACYSPDYSHPSRPQFREFVQTLARIFEAEVITAQAVSPEKAANPRYRAYLPPSIYRLVRHLYWQAGLQLRKRGIY
ncbi:MAG: hypothetical protein R3264_10205 [Anaerolineae bacterium]|nr:hypothetical protein [Anaerolineae bacterium]